MERKDLDENIIFIAKHYKAGLFDAEKTLRIIKPTIRKVWTWQRIAAASCIIIVLGATAALLIRDSYYSKRSVEIENTVSPVSPAIPLETISKVIDFDDTPLPIVIEQINSVYDVEIVNLPAHAEDYRLSLHYEGNVIDLIESINEILGTNLVIKTL